MLKDLLEKRNCFKLVCGAGNEDSIEVEKLVTLYAKAGCRFFDLSAKEEIIDAAKSGILKSGVKDAYLCVSVGIKGDPHISKAQIDYEKCIGCGKCDEICPNNAIIYHKVKNMKCIGCGKCAKVCSKGAISYTSENIDLNIVLPPLIEKGIDCIELHAMGTDEEDILSKWETINKLYTGMVSICTSHGKISDEAMIKRIKRMLNYRSPYTTIIQADGFPMSGGRDDYKTTLQAVATAEIVQNENLPVYLMLSGGTNTKTAELASLCGIKFNGVAVGSYARKIVREQIDCEDFLENPVIFEKALIKAEKLVQSVQF